MRARRRLFAALLIGVAATPALGLSLARDGRTSHRVVLAAGASPAERTAAQELVTYLELVTSASFPLIPEGRVTDDAPAAIWVGPTAKASSLGIDAQRLGSEEWMIRTAGEHLVLVGGRPRGTLYAVYHLLEDHVGVRWWTPWDEHVPARPDLEIEVDAAGRPAFAYRDIHGAAGASQFHARNRANGHYSFLTVAYGGREAYGPPFTVHTFFMYASPESYFDDHPEFFSERDGVRVGKRTQLCLTNDKLRELVVDRLEQYIEQSREQAGRQGERAPRLFSISQNDWPRPCTCEPCRGIDEQQASHSGSLVHFVNRIAESIAERYPEVLVDTLAYDYTFAPPEELKLRDNVVLRLAALKQRDFARPLTDRANRESRRALEGWRERTAHLRIWGYMVTFGRRANNLPLPNLRVIADDFRYYREQRVEGLFLQHDYPVLADMRDLKLWVVLKLAEDPTRRLDALVDEFTDGYYGPAGAVVREYLDELERVARSRPPAIRYPVSYEQYRHLTPRFLRRAQSMFERAEAAVGHDPLLLRRVRHARLPLDRATLLRWDDELARSSTRPGAGQPVDPHTVARRYRDTAFAEIDRRLRPERRDDKREAVAREIDKLLGRIGDRGALALPPGNHKLLNR